METRRIKPLTGQALVEILPEEKLVGSLVLPDHTASPEEQQQRDHRPSPPAPVTGIVRAIGQWPKLKNGMARMPDFGIGAKVLLPKYCGQEMQRGIGKRLKMVMQSDVLAVLT